MSNEEALEALAMHTMDVKPNDRIPLEEKRVMLGHMQRQEWSQLGMIVTRRAMVDLTTAEEGAAFLAEFYDAVGSAFERRAADYPLDGYRGLFQFADLQLRILRAEWHLWLSRHSS